MVWSHQLIDLVCLGHTWTFRNLLCSVHQIQSWLPKQYFAPYLVMLWPWLLIFESYISEMLNSSKFFQWQIIMPKSPCTTHTAGVMGPKVIFNHIWLHLTLTLDLQMDLWISNFHKCLILPQSFWLKKNPTWSILMEPQI